MNIYKYELYPERFETYIAVDLPRDANVLSVIAQRDSICIYALVDPDAPKVTRRFLVQPTGLPLPEAIFDFIGTVAMYDATHVFHVFEWLRDRSAPPSPFLGS